VGMLVKRLIKNINGKYNPLGIWKRTKMRKMLINKDITFLCPNCIGGILFHDLGLQFQSPTVNLMMYQTDFAKFLLNLRHYLAQEFVPILDPVKENVPCAKLDDIVVYFTHYSSVEEGISKWKKRMQRMNFENMFVFLEERDGIDYETIKQLGSLDIKGLVIFTAHNYPELPYCLYIPEYEKDGEVGNILEINQITQQRKYEQLFDFVKWFNEAHGMPYDVKTFSLL